VSREGCDRVKATAPTFTRSLPSTTALYGAMEGTPYAIRRELMLSPFGAPCNTLPVAR
jgi:hypothetical protein